MRSVLVRCAVGVGLLAACTASVNDPDALDQSTTGGVAPTGGRSATTGGTSGSLSSGGRSASGGGAGTPPAGGSPTSPVAGSGGLTPGATGGAAPAAGGAPSAGGSPGGAATGGSPVAGPLPATCADAAAPYTIQAQALDASLLPFTGQTGFNDALFARVPLAVGANNQVYVGFTSEEGGSYDALIAELGGATVRVPGAINGGITVTNDGLAVLLFEPLTGVDERTWAAVRRIAPDGSEVFQTDLFRSPNLEDVGTKGAPSTSRLGYIAGTDQIVAYFAHTQRYDDDVRHQGGYLATLDASGTQTVLSGWFGSHNLDQRLWVDATGAVVLGLGDAYPEGIFFDHVTPRADPEVLLPLASAGNGATNGQLGGIVELGGELLVPFVTNRSIPADLDAGTWPDIDEAIADQIRDAAANGSDVGLLRMPKSGDVPSPLEPVWIDVGLASGARIERLKAAAYGDATLLLAWAEITGSGRSASTHYYSLVVDASGAVCQPKTEIAAANAFTAGDDIVRRADGALVWANVLSDRIQVILLIPR